MPTPSWQSRTVEQLVSGMPTSDGAGVKLTRVLTQNLQRRLDPFLMLDEFRSDNPGDYIAGFPAHPHRGFETVTYMLAGRMRHRDSGHNEGLLGPGGVQWMTAGRGVIHSEMPEQEDGLMHGFQLWINLPAARKMIPAAYRDIPAEQIPCVEETGGVIVRVIAGHYQAQPGAIQQADTTPLYLDLHLPAGVEHEFAIAESHNAFVYVYQGSISIEGVRVPSQRMAILNNEGQGVRLRADEAARVLLLSGQPLHEPIAQHGPFVMNTRAELEQAVIDYQQGRLVEF